MKNKPNSEKSMANRTTQKYKWRTELQEMMSMPFVRIDLQLEMDQNDIKEAIVEWQISSTGITNYEEYLLYEDERKTQVSFIGKLFPRADKYDIIIEEFRNRVRYLVQLPANGIYINDVTLAVDAYVTAVKLLVNNLNSDDINSFIMIDRFLAVAPSLISRDKIKDDDKIKLLVKLEDVISEIEGIRSGLSTEQLNDLILLVTHVVYCYKFYCYQYNIGVSLALINGLFNMPQWMGTLYLSVEGHIKIKFSLLCLHLSFDLIMWDERLGTKLGISFKTYDTLRYILDDSLQLLKRRNTSFYIPIYQWFLSRIDADITQHYANNPKLEYYDLHDIDRMKILACCERFSNYRYPVTVETVVNFLMQFKNRRDAESVIRVLDAIDFLEFWQLAERLEDAILQMIKRNGDLSVCPLGPISGSTSLMHYYMAHSGIKNVSFFNNVTDAIRKGEKRSAICFIDDCAITGIQSNEIFQKLFGKKKSTDSETLVLSGNDRKELLSRKVGVALSVVSDTGLDGLINTFKSLNVNDAFTTYGSMTLEKDKAFSPASKVSWKDSNERKRMSVIFQNIGIRLLHAKAQEKKWSKKEQQRHSLGYGDFQRLLIFPYSVPKSTVIALWAGINDFSSPWKPLFPLAVQDDSYYPVQ